jgi:hypothetical protein
MEERRMTLSDYHERKAERIERLKTLAQATQAASEATLDQACKMADVIPFGQPILVGHYSEKRDRNYRDRISAKFEKSAELEKKAQYYQRRAAAAVNNEAISSDDPDAIEALKEKLQNLKASHEMMIQGNKIVRSKKLTDDQKIGELMKLGLGETSAKLKLQPNCFKEIGFAKYEITNSGANIRNVEKRIEQLEKARKDETTEIQIGDISIINSVEENRIMVMFPGIPAESIRDYLKGRGFRWSPKNQAWQAYRSAALWIPEIVKMLTVMPAYVNPTEIPQGCDA